MPPVRGGPAAVASRVARRRLSKHVLQVLSATVHGRFRTVGTYSAATERGTAWETADRCDGTLTAVQRGTVDVSDFRRRVTITLRAGQSYLASAAATTHK